MERYLTVDEVAEICRTSPSTVRYWLQQDKGPHSVKRGRRRLYPQSGVEQWLKTGESNPEAAA